MLSASAFVEKRRACRRTSDTLCVGEMCVRFGTKGGCGSACWSSKTRAKETWVGGSMYDVVIWDEVFFFPACGAARNRQFGSCPMTTWCARTRCCDVVANYRTTPGSIGKAPDRKTASHKQRHQGHLPMLNAHERSQHRRMRTQSCGNSCQLEHALHNFAICQSCEHRLLTQKKNFRKRTRTHGHPRGVDRRRSWSLEVRTLPASRTSSKRI